MKKYINHSHKQVCVEFEGWAQFLRRGESVSTSDKTITVPDGVVVEEDETTKKVKKTKK